MGVLNIPQLQSAGQGAGGEMISSLAQLLLRSKLEEGQDTRKAKLASEQAERAAATLLAKEESSRKLASDLATEERTRAGSSLADVMGIPRTVPTIPDPNVPEGIRRPADQLEPSPNPKYQSLVNQPADVSKDAAKNYYGESFKSQFPKEDKDREITDIVKFETITGTSPKLRGTPEYKKAYVEWNSQMQSVNRPRFVPYTSPDGTHTEMVNVNDQAERSVAEGRGLVPGSPEKMSAGTKEDVSSTKELQKIMSEIEKTYSPKYTGMGDSALGWITGKTDIGVNTEEQKFRTLVNSLMNITGKLRAGSAWTGPEIKRLEEELANTAQGDTKFREALKWAKQSASNKLGAIEGTARDTRTYYNPQPAPAQGGQGSVSPRMQGESISDYMKRTRR